MTLKILSIITSICLIGSTVPAKAQSQAEKDFLVQQLTKTPEKAGYKMATNNRNEIQVVFSGLFLFYKNFFSSQDSYRCSFYPSCSEYGLLAVKQLGMAHGLVSTFDRLTRCNGIGSEKYEIDTERKVYIDNVESKKP